MEKFRQWVIDRLPNMGNVVGKGLFLLFSGYFFAQELPPVQNYTPVDYGAENQNWGLSQSKDRTIYSANNSGLLQFNGAYWKLYPSPNGSVIRSVMALGELVYTGCYMEFGFWKKDARGELLYHSLTGTLDTPLIEDEQFWNILEYDGWVLFQSLQRIYVYNQSDGSIEIIDSKSTRARIFKVDNEVFFQKTGTGLFKIENGSSALVSDDPIVRGNVIIDIIQIGEKPLVVTETGAFYFLGTEALSQWFTAFQPTNIYSCLQLKDGSIILGTISNGIYQLDQAGKTILHINKEKGLNDNTVLSIYEDSEANLWLTLDNGISVINMDAPFKEYRDEAGRLGVVYAAKIYGGNLYLGTNQGLFAKNSSSEGDGFSLVPNTEGQVWCLREFNGRLFCGHNKGTFLIEGDRAQLISDFPGTWEIKEIQGQHNLLLQGNYNGLSVLALVNGQWAFRNKIEGFNMSSRFFEFLAPDKILVNHEYKGVYKIALDADFGKVTATDKEDPQGVGASLVNYREQVLYSTDRGIFRYGQKAQKFVKDSLWTAAFFLNGEAPIGILIPDNNSGGLWGFSDRNILFVTADKFKNVPKTTKIPIPAHFRKNMGVLGFESLTHLKDAQYLIGTSNGYVTLDLSKLKQRDYTIAINTVQSSFLDTDERPVDFRTENQFKFKENNIRFSFGVPEYDKYTEVDYQYKLIGLYDEWSRWSTTPEAYFSNLPYGTYTFVIRARLGNVFTGNEDSYSFKIAKPWYLSITAIAAYVLLGILLSAAIHKLYKTYYRKQREQILLENRKRIKRRKLKAKKKIVQIANEKLAQEIESKNRELAVSTMSLIKKNEFLSTIKDQLKESKDTHQISSVIRTIDRNINNADDWKFFEEAFNNADKDFLKQVKQLHPDLTSNDLKLCAYLRLNLSSKEIAPLLNISARSIEVKRYRLRKKMQLPHEASLTSYILGL